jgi:capsule polysaccharide export protein KpsE/RkpR
MKKFILLTIFCTSVGITSYAQQTDPTLTGAVIAQSEMLKKIFNNREKTQNKIIAAETAVTAAMERMHKVEDQMLDYLSNVQGAMQNLYQIKRAAELTTKEIPKICRFLKNLFQDILKVLLLHYSFQTN